MRLLADRLVNQYGIDSPKVHIPMGGASPKKPIERYLPELAGSVESTSQLLTLLFSLLMFAHGTYLTLSHRNLTSNWCTPVFSLMHGLLQLLPRHRLSADAAALHVYFHTRTNPFMPTRTHGYFAGP